MAKNSHEALGYYRWSKETSVPALSSPSNYLSSSAATTTTILLKFQRLNKLPSIVLMLQEQAVPDLTAHPQMIILKVGMTCANDMCMSSVNLGPSVPSVAVQMQAKVDLGMQGTHCQTPVSVFFFH